MTPLSKEMCVTRATRCLSRDHIHFSRLLHRARDLSTQLMRSETEEYWGLELLSIHEIISFTYNG